MKTKLLKKLRNKACKNWRVTEIRIWNVYRFCIEQNLGYCWSHYKLYAIKETAILECKKLIRESINSECLILRLLKQEQEKKVIYPAASE